MTLSLSCKDLPKESPNKTTYIRRMTSNLRFMVRFLLLRWVLPLAATSVWATLSYVNMEHNCWFVFVVVSIRIFKIFIKIFKIFIKIFCTGLVTITRSTTGFLKGRDSSSFWFGNFRYNSIACSKNLKII